LTIGAQEETRAELAAMNGGRLRSWCICAFALVAATAKAETHTFTIDPARTTVQFEIRHFFGKVVGQFHDVHGTLRIDVDHPENSSVIAKCPSRTVDTANRTRDSHLRSELFETDKFPEVIFRSEKVVRTANDQADVTGDLTLHGVTHPIVLHVTLLERTKQPGGSEISRWRATGGNFSRHVFGLLWSRGVEAISGIGDEITLRIECEARE
jgi:polyisoprenoid-binding protein YceI